MKAKTKPTKKPGSSTKPVPAAVPAAQAVAPAPSPSEPPKPAPTPAQIAQRAYEIWVETGKQGGRDEKNWFEAEWQLRQK
jgi:hypothetical protein